MTFHIHLLKHLGDKFYILSKNNKGQYETPLFVLFRYYNLENLINKYINNEPLTFSRRMFYDQLIKSRNSIHILEFQDFSVLKTIKTTNPEWFI